MPLLPWATCDWFSRRRRGGRMMGCVIPARGRTPCQGKLRKSGVSEATDLQPTSPPSRRRVPAFTKSSECPVSTSKPLGWSDYNKALIE